MRCEGVDWTKVDCIHLDEYVGTPPASPNLPHPQQLFARSTQLTRSGSGLGFGAGMDNTHGASFAKYLKERFVDQLPAHNKPKSFTFVSGLGDPHEANRPTPPRPRACFVDECVIVLRRVVQECRRLKGVIESWPEIDVAFIGIGENGHLAFNE